MTVLYDHIISVLVASVIILLLFNVQQRSQKTSVERALMYKAKAQTLDLASILERDLSNAGFQTPPVEPAILVAEPLFGDRTDSLMFWGMGANGTRTRIAYGIQVVDSMRLDGDMLPLYELRRYERRGAGFVRVGGSAQTLTTFRVDLLDENNQLSNRDSAVRFRVKLASAVYPSKKEDGYLKGYRRLTWGITLAPTSLQTLW